MKCVSISKKSGDEVYYTVILMLIVKIILYSKIHC